MTSPSEVQPFCEIGKMGGKLWKWYILGTRAQAPPGHTHGAMEVVLDNN